MAAAEPERVVVITGGTGGIGLHSATACARAGARVLVTGRDAARGQGLSRRCHGVEVKLLRCGRFGAPLRRADFASSPRGHPLTSDA